MTYVIVIIIIIIETIETPPPSPCTVDIIHKSEQMKIALVYGIFASDVNQIDDNMLTSKHYFVEGFRCYHSMLCHRWNFPLNT